MYIRSGDIKKVLNESDRMSVFQVISSKIKNYNNNNLELKNDEIKSVLSFEYLDVYAHIMAELEDKGYNLSIEICSLEDAFINFMS